MNERIGKIKTHISDWRYIYIAGVTSFIVGGVVVYVLKSNSSFQTIAPVFNNTNKMVINLIERSTPSKPVHLIGTNLVFSSLSEAARETGHSLAKLSRHINGLLPDLNGDVFELLEFAA